jgi:chromosome segregation ATPase
MDSQQITFWASLGGIVVAALGGFIAQLIKRSDPDLQHKIQSDREKAELESRVAEERAATATWERTKDLINSYASRITTLEAGLKEEQSKRSELELKLKSEIEKRDIEISDLKLQIKSRDKKIEELTKQIQAQGKRRGGTFG